MGEVCGRSLLSCISSIVASCVFTRSIRDEKVPTYVPVQVLSGCIGVYIPVQV
jgi:hypothetical protein